MQFKAPWKNVCALKMLNKEKITHENINKIQKKTIPITKSFLKVTDPELKNRIYSDGKFQDITMNPSQDDKNNRVASPVGIVTKLWHWGSAIVMFFKRLMYRNNC